MLKSNNVSVDIVDEIFNFLTEVRNKFKISRTNSTNQNRFCQKWTASCINALWKELIKILHSLHSYLNCIHYGNLLMDKPVTFYKN